jgi:hypothetical protein
MKADDEGRPGVPGSPQDTNGVLCQSEECAMGEPLEAMREEWARLVWNFLQLVSHDLRVPSDLADEAEELRGAMEKLNFWEY